MMLCFLCFELILYISLISGENYPEQTTGVELPPGNIQFHRVYADGYQNYICTILENGTWTWVLDHPVAVLRRYNSADLNPEKDPIVGNHEHTLTKNFTVNTAIWTLGANCNPMKCDSVTDKLFGTPIKLNNNKPYQTLPLTLFQTLSEEPNIGPLFQTVRYIQRLDIIGGVVPVTEGCSLTNNGSHYNANYTAHYIFARRSRSSSIKSDLSVAFSITFLWTIRFVFFQKNLF